MAGRAVVRVGLGAGVCAPALILAWALATGCSSSSSAAAPGADAATDSTSTVDAAPEASGDDGALPGPDVDAGPPVVVPRAYVVNASPDAPPLRLCIALGAPSDGGAVLVVGGYPASPAAPVPGFATTGLYPGYGAVLDDHGLDLDTLTVDVLALDATNPAVAASIAADGGVATPCERLVGPDGLGAASDAGGVLRAGRDFWLVGSIPMGALGHGTSWLAAITGCVPGDPGAATRCPPGYDPAAGNLRLLTWQLDTATPVAAGAIGAQVAQASSEWELFRQASGGAAVSAGFFVPGDGGVPEAASDAGGDAEGGSGDAGSVDASGPTPSPWASYVELPVAADAGFGALAPATLVPVTGLDPSTAAFGAEVVSPMGKAVPPTPSAVSLPLLQALTWPAGVPDGGALRGGAGFVFVLLGDPAESAMYVSSTDGGPSAADAGGIFNGHYPHFLAFPVAR